MAWIVGLAVRSLARLMRRDPKVAMTVDTVFWLVCIVFVTVIGLILLLPAVLPQK